MYEINRKKQISELKKSHYEWREQNFKHKEGFFPVFKGFKTSMKNLSPGAISLFIYLGLHSNNLTGESSHSIERIAEFFGKSTRTISMWIKELEKEQLIKRIQVKFNDVSHTFILPYGSNTSKNDDEGVNNLDNKLPF